VEAVVSEERAAPPAADAPEPRPAAPEARREPVSILLVDDRPENLLALEAILEPLGQRLVRAHSGDEALRHLLTQDFALILLDVQMPGMNGFEAAQLIKARERSRHIPIIFLTAINKEDQYVFKGYEVGAVDYLFKPFNPDVLRSKVAVFVDLHHARERLRRQEQALRDGERRELELRLRAELLEAEARAAARLNDANRQLQERQAQLEQAMQARSRFYASMSHELRTPINAIIGYNTLLLDGIYGPLDDQQQHGIERTHKAAKHLLELVNDVLDLSKIEAGKFDLSIQPTSFPSLIEDLFVTVRPLADEHGCALSLRHDGASVTVETDPRRVRQILLNLLSNAIKFGGGAPIEVTSSGTEAGGIEVSVRDHGPGIAAADLERVFDEFVQLTRGGGGAHGGTGLGLAISKRLAALVGGDLSAQSEPGVGSVFRVQLPRAPQRPAARDDAPGDGGDDPTPRDDTSRDDTSRADTSRDGASRDGASGDDGAARAGEGARTAGGAAAADGRLTPAARAE
jgi:signal transduction histidine kinase